MNRIEINIFMELEKITDLLHENDIIVNLANCDRNERLRIIDFFIGMTFLSGAIKKLNKDEFEIILAKEN